MSYAEVIYKTNHAFCDEIIDHLKACAGCFKPPLDTYVDIDKYGAKIYESADRFEAWHGNALVGLVACYLNDKNVNKGYVTDVSVKSDYQG